LSYFLLENLFIQKSLTVGPTCHVPRAALGLCGNAPLLRGCHVPRVSHTP
jgi:hypothetical protein